MIVTFCGHAKFSNYEKYEHCLLDLLEKIVGDQSADMYLGGYGGFDLFAYDCCKKYKKTHPNISLVLVTPYPLFSTKSTSNVQTTCYDAVLYPELEEKMPRFAISYRNRYMIEQASYIIAYIDHDWGGAYQSYLHAKRKKKTVFNLREMQP